ncbi:hypothetical protein Patl1_33102 [Pistacia atlantica]|uniref:Uncharacterized protein n=1 Tax=Pistacia atlantica TaxID=434234 RepID=A0ACC1ANN3_9ROSI|nr:hypothetical protein Patl1_33102 [Pistacia atlantica]
MLNLVPSITFILGVLCRMEKVDICKLSTQAKILGSLVAFGGAAMLALYKGIVVVSSHKDNFHHYENKRFIPHGDSWIKGSIFLLFACFAMAAFYILQALAIMKYPALITLTLHSSLTGGLFAIIIAVIQVLEPHSWRLSWNIALLGPIFNGIMIIGITFYVQTLVVRRRGPVFMTTFRPLATIISAIMGLLILGDALHLGGSQEFSSPDLETTPVDAKTDVAQATPPDNFTIDVAEYEGQNLEPEKEPDDENDTPQKGLIGLAVATVGLTSEAAYHLEVRLQAFRISFEQSPKKAKQDHDNGKTNGKAGESDVIDVEFEEFCKAIEANLSIEQMVEILEANDQDSSGPDPVVVIDKEVSNDSNMDEKLGFEEDEGSEDNHNQNNTNKVENNNATMDSCGEDCVEDVTVEKARECLSLFVIVAMNCCLMFRLDFHTMLMRFNFLASFEFLFLYTYFAHAQLVSSSFLIFKKTGFSLEFMQHIGLENASTSTATYTTETYTPLVEQPEVIIPRCNQLLPYSQSTFGSDGHSEH